MCGIFGYTGHRKNAAELIFKGLKSLEYRGYDSWGITVKNGETLDIERHVGKIVDTAIKLPESNLGIGHTRWATHGGVTTENAHPHLDCTKKIALLHNGIVENFQILKDDLIKKGHTFLSETDTEVMPHLIEELMKDGHSFIDATRLMFNSLKGLNAIVAVHSMSSQIVAAKNGSPLVVGIGKGEYFIASDVVGILPYTRDVIFLKDNEMVALGKDLQVFSLPKGQKVRSDIEKITWEIEQSERGKFDHFMIKEIYDQPMIIRNIAENYSDQINDLREVINDAKGTFFYWCRYRISC